MIDDTCLSGVPILVFNSVVKYYIHYIYIYTHILYIHIYDLCMYIILLDVIRLSPDTVVKIYWINIWLYTPDIFSHQINHLYNYGHVIVGPNTYFCVGIFYMVFIYVQSRYRRFISTITEDLLSKTSNHLYYISF